MRRPLIGVMAFMFAYSVFPAGAQECPIQDRAGIPQALKDTAGCDASMKLFAQCTSASGTDVEYGAIVTEKCEADFLTKLSKRQRSEYSRGQRACENKHRNQQGSMYRAFEAYCSAALAQRTARRYRAKR